MRGVCRWKRATAVGRWLFLSGPEVWAVIKRNGGVKNSSKKRER